MRSLRCPTDPSGQSRRGGVRAKRLGCRLRWRLCWRLRWRLCWRLRWRLCWRLGW